MRYLFFIFLSLFVIGCAFFQGERNAEIFITTKPEGAAIYKIYTRYMTSGRVVNENTQFIGQTPTVVMIPKDTQVMIVFAKNGYKNKEFIMRTGFKKIYMDDSKTYNSCMNEDHYGWVTGGIYKNIVERFAPGVRKQYCYADRYQYKLDLEKV